MKKIFSLILAISLLSCNNSDEGTVPNTESGFVIKGVDASMVPQIREVGTVTRNRAGQPEDMLVTLKNQGVNTIRLRLWHNPAEGHSGMDEVKALAQEIKGKGMKVWLTVHYSDTWADPSQQTKPAAWQGQNYVQLKQSVYNYTKDIVQQLHPDYIQIGNEINGGMLWPEGSYNSMEQFRGLVAEGIRAVRENAPAAKIMLHYAGHTGAVAFYSNFSNLDYDIITLSYYPVWHGMDLNALQNNMSLLGNQFGKQVVIAETAYPFTLDWNDFTNNIIGSNSQILPQYPATPQGQKDYLARIAQIATQHGNGFCYWGGDWISFNGPQGTNGSAVENAALWDFDNTALPALDVFKE